MRVRGADWENTNDDAMVSTHTPSNPFRFFLFPLELEFPYRFHSTNLFHLFHEFLFLGVCLKDFFVFSFFLIRFSFLLFNFRFFSRQVMRVKWFSFFYCLSQVEMIESNANFETTGQFLHFLLFSSKTEIPLKEAPRHVHSVKTKNKYFLLRKPKREKNAINKYNFDSSVLAFNKNVFLVAW